MVKTWQTFVVAMMAVILSAPTALGQDNLDAELARASRAAQPGPNEVALFDQAKIAIPQDCGFLPSSRSTAAMAALGVTADESVAGVVLPLEQPFHPWAIIVSFARTGCVRDTDQNQLRNDALLERFRSAQDRAGSSEYAVHRWQVRPSLNSALHSMTWMAVLRPKQDSRDEHESAITEAVVLGRYGLVDLELISSASQATQTRPTFDTLVESVKFAEGKRYEDFVPGKDRAATCTLADLVVREYSIYKGSDSARSADGNGSSATAPSGAAMQDGGMGPAEEQARNHAERGPRKVSIAGGGEVDIPANHLYLRKTLATQVAAEFGLEGNLPVQGMILSADQSKVWFVLILMRQQGHVVEPGPDTVTPEKLWTAMQAGVDVGNADALKASQPAVEVVRWAAKPTYDAARKTLICGVVVKAGDPDGTEVESWEALTLGKRGVLTLALYGSTDDTAENKRVIETLARGVQFSEGNRYADFKPEIDRVASEPLVGAPDDGMLSLNEGMRAIGGNLFKMAAIFGIPAVIAGAAAVWLTSRKSK